ncbi:unnamed protein product [Orchesella dallaii]|uniref:Uncharacterized protein n=1 Tax=Orchesella dallaii TaxID=48710 RepID=A0ABP1PQU6_9HEXA
MSHTPTQLEQSRENFRSLPSTSSVGQFSPYEFLKNTHKRQKRSPYPPGFVTWTLKEPCICSPGQLNCRCYSTSSASSEGTQKSRRRRSRSKKSKSN